MGKAKQVPAALFALRTIMHESTGFTTSEKSVVRKAIKREFSEGDLVLVVATSKPNKLAVEWKGPGKIEKKLSETNYVVSFEGKKDHNQVYHDNMLKPYHKRAELANLMLTEGKSDIEDMDEIFPAINSEPTLFDFEEIKESSSLNNKLNEQQMQELHELLLKCSKIFPNKPGNTHLVTHDIQLIENTPIHCKPYRISPRQTEILISEIDKMFKRKIIEIGNSDYTSPMILVEVAGRDPRPCIDYRKLNKLTKTQLFPLPNIKEREEAVAASKYIYVLDFKKGYCQIPLTPNAQRLATFVTSFGTFKRLRMPFGLKNAPFTFSKMMADILHGCEYFAVPYLDDVLKLVGKTS
ncbi:Retrovirus-related Pol polyprotein from transposon 412 [Araneus ventricosus]|uniref:Retrovirus-related Pol polyprotein from transposon 412 n=1 Tax=Araneus ventricosus TaxID=182803 RepID=A0A4Y2E9V7_ARAVE|nr:Retrovirus-related Pol polyprotein from transposon 412 [Araneus ventricosus]